MVLLSFIMASGLVFAQTGNDARPLLEKVSQATRAAKTWQAEGVSVTEITGDGVNTRLETRFRSAFRGPLETRHESSGAEGGVRVCDGTVLWIHFPRVNFYTRNPISEEKCIPAADRWDNLTASLVSALMTGRDQVPFEGVPRDCQVVVAEYNTNAPLAPGVAVYGHVRRTLCIDPDRLIVLRDRFEAIPEPGKPAYLQTVVTISFSRYQRGAVLSDALFRFEPPAGSFLNSGISPQAGAVEPRTGVYRSGAPGLVVPTILHSIDPEYSEEARKAKISGSVVLSLEVDPEGVPRNIRVVRPLGYGLDEKAIAAVSQWRFKPGMKDGKPVTVITNIETTFRLK